MQMVSLRTPDSASQHTSVKKAMDTSTSHWCSWRLPKWVITTSCCFVQSVTRKAGGQTNTPVSSRWQTWITIQSSGTGRVNDRAWSERMTGRKPLPSDDDRPAAVKVPSTNLLQEKPKRATLLVYGGSVKRTRQMGPLQLGKCQLSLTLRLKRTNS